MARRAGDRGHFEALGADYAQRAEVSDEAIAAIRAAWTSEVQTSARIPRPR